MHVERELKKELVKISDFLLSLVAALPAGVIVIDSNGVVVAANQEALNLFGKQEMEVGSIIDKAIFSAIAGIGSLEMQLQTCIQESQFTLFIPEIRIMLHDSHVFIAVTGKPISGGMLIFVENITYVRKIEEAERMEADFISIASHQLRTPLTGIQWVVERFTKKEKLTPKGREYLDEIHESAERLTEMVDNLLDLSRIEVGRVGITPESLEVISFMKSLLNETIPLQDKKRLKMVFTDHPTKLQVETDKSGLRNIAQSLISNAIEYSRKGGKITVALDKHNDSFVLKVQDVGIGIPKMDQLRIFEKFVRAGNAKLHKADGNGIGLYIAERAVVRMGGKIWFESEENRGSTFYVELPLKLKS